MESTILLPTLPKRRQTSFSAFVLLLVVGATAAAAASPPETKKSPPETEKFSARDSLAELTDPLPDAQTCLDGLAWPPAEFTVTSVAPAEKPYHRLVRFPSPRPTGNEVNDLVSMEWYAVTDDSGQVLQAPAILVVHESGSAMPVGRLFARSMQLHSIHGFLIHLPYYGERRGDVKRPAAEQIVPTMKQGITDVRRARDAIAALPAVDSGHIGIQGTSLGGFVTATAAGLDGCFASTFIMLAGGDLYGLIANGQKDSAKVRQRLAEAGFQDEKLRELVRQIEPNRVAHRLNRETTWIFSAEQDRVVPIQNAIGLATKAGLDDGHHVRLPGNHYTAIVSFPVILQQVIDHIRVLSDSSAARPAPIEP